MERATRRLVAATFSAAALAVAAASPSALGAWREEFEGPQVSGRALEADASYRVLRHQRIHEDRHSGQGSELIEIAGAGGSYVFFGYDIEPARVAAELTPSVWVKSNRPGIQILARVILPHTADPRTGQPAATLIRGGSYTSPGTWQELRIVDAPQLLSRQVRVLRVEIGPEVDPREAYIDQIVLNVYGGPGQTAVAIDDLQVSGVVPYEVAPAAAVSESPAVSVEPTAASVGAQHQVGLSGSLLLVDGRPFFPRIVSWQGEPLEWLKEGGFNVIRSAGPLTQEMLREAQRLGIWLIGPPPQRAGSAEIAEISPAYEPVLAWQLGEGLAERELPATSAIAQEMRQAGRWLSRPLLCGAEEELRSFSRQVDVLSAHRFPLGTSLELKDYGAWLRERPQLARPGTPLWTVVQTEPAPALAEQTAALFGSGAAQPTIDVDSLRLLTYQAFAAGARGIEFGSNSRLDSPDRATRLRALALALLNQELELLEPWGAAGTYVTQVTSNDRSAQGVVLNADGSRLVIATRCSQGSQYVAEPPSQGAVAGAMDPTFIVPGVPESHKVYELTPAGLRPLRQKRVAGGMSVTVEDFLLTSVMLITPDPLVVNAMSQRTVQGAPRAARLQRELAAALLADVEQVGRRLSGQTQLPPADAALNSARAALTRADQLLAQGDYARAYFAARNATLPLDNWKHGAWRRSVATLGAPASPPAASFNTLPEHLGFQAWLSQISAGENVLAGGDCENLQTMTGAGWRHFQHPQDGIQTSVELSPLAPYAGRFSLRLQARPQRPETAPALVETPPLWITSAPVRVEAGDIVCIHGHVWAPAPISGSVDGLMIIDSLGGEALAERIGQSPGWREFVMYRAAPYSGDLTVTFALSGLGEAWIDDVSIRMLRGGWQGGR